MQFHHQKHLLLFALVLLSFNAIAQVSITGKITAADGAPVKFATVHLLNTNLTVMSGENGGFAISNVRAGNYTMQVSAVGFAQQQVELKGTNFIEITLKPSAAYLDDVLVTAQKKEEKAFDVPFSVSAISAREVRQYRLWNSRDLAGIVPNLYSANPGDNRNVTSIRGITSASYDPSVTTYIDGVSQFSLDTYIAELLDIERIEVLRGPQGTLYGRNAMGGVINIITKQPGNKTSGFAEVNPGNYGLQRYAAGLRLPLKQNKLYAGAAVVFNKLDGYYTNTYNNTSFDEQRSVMANYYLKYLPNEKLAVWLNLKHQSVKNKGAFPLVFGIADAFENPYKLAQDAVAEMNDNILNASLSISHSGRTVNFTAQTAYQGNYRYYDNAIDADFSPLDGVSIINNYGKNHNTSKVFTQEFRLSSSPSAGNNWKWVAGSYLFLHKNPVKQATRFGRDALMTGAPDSLFSIINTTAAKNYGAAVYGQINHAVTKQIELFFGLRYDWERKRLSILSEYQKDPHPQPLFAIVPDTAATVTLDAFSPKAGVLFKVDNNFNLYFTYSRGYRAGGLTQLSLDPAQVPLYPYEPEYSNNFEAGAKSSLLNGRLHANLAIFVIRANNVQVPTLVLPDAITITRNAGKLLSKGIELELSAVPIRGLQITYNFGYTDAVYKTLKLPQQGEEKNFSGNRQIFTPDVTSLLAIQSESLITRQLKFIARAEWFYFGAQYFDPGNQLRQSPYHLLNVRTGLSFKQHELVFWMRNLADTRYVDYSYEFGGVHLGNPKTYGISVHVGF
jgi:iron complex outermembrane recepter protein